MRNTTFLLLLFLYVGIASCKDDDDDTPATCSTAWSTDLQDEINAVTSAATAYGNNPSAANCTSYKNAFQNYINALKPYGNCSSLTGQNRTDFENALKEAEDNLATLC